MRNTWNKRVVVAPYPDRFFAVHSGCGLLDRLKLVDPGDVLVWISEGKRKAKIRPRGQL